MSAPARRALRWAAALMLVAACRGQDGEVVHGELTPAADVVQVADRRQDAFPTEPAEPAVALDEIAALGRVLDPLPLLQSWSALSSARAREANARLELARVRALARNADNASARELEAAQLAASDARSALTLALAQVKGSWGSSDPEQLAPFAEALARGEVAVARIELPAGQSAVRPRAVRVSAPGFDGSAHAAQVIGPAGAVDPTLQGPAFLVGLAPDPPPQGAVLTAWVDAGGEPRRGVYLPASAVVWHEGTPLAFVALAPNQFMRRSLELALPLPDGFLVTAGVETGERYVRVGAQQLLSSLRTAHSGLE